MLTPRPPIHVKGLSRSTTRSAAELHVSGGIRAVGAGDKRWSWLPALAEGRTVQLDPLPINQIHALATDVGETLFGGDQISGLESSLAARVWTPLDGPQAGGLQPADLWNAVASNAERAADQKFAALARHIAFSLHAAGIRLRDASDHYHDQLIAALGDKRQSGERFSNIPMRDLHLAFHSVLSELASARDYLAAAFAHKLGAPDKVDALNRMADWLRAPSRSAMRSEPVISDMLEAYNAKGSDPWLYELTEYRNRFLHRQPMGASGVAPWLRYEEYERNGLTFPRIELPIADDADEAGPDALKQFVALYRRMTSLSAKALRHAPYDSELQHFVAD